MPLDHRLLALSKRAFRVAAQLRRDAFLDHVQLIMACSRVEAVRYLNDLAAHGYALVRGHGSSALVFPGAGMDTDTLVSRGIDVRRRA